MTELGRQTRALAMPAIAWSVHFIAIYALISAACTPRTLIGQAALDLWGLGVTLICLAAALWPVVRPPAGQELRRAIRWGGTIFALAILFEGLPLAYSSSCGG